ncbi:MAG: hypothetical protein KDN19_14800 [Verrucomicrobiae bacterium]|nr:hypothetical protein [Verrucomicrobiae bacterium]
MMQNCKLTDGQMGIEAGRPQRSEKRRAKGAYTVVEILVSVVIVGILIGIAVPSYETFRKRAEKARCIGNLKVLHTGFDSYILDNNHWPQLPEDSFDMEESDYFRIWIKALEPYGVGQESWLCSSDRVLKALPDAERDEYVSSYLPTQFNSHRFTPYRWNQPWVTERGDYHGKGAHVLMPDGSITTSQSPWGER